MVLSIRRYEKVVPDTQKQSLWQVLGAVRCLYNIYNRLGAYSVFQGVQMAASAPRPAVRHPAIVIR